jgi:hypothetical protein
MPQRFPLEPRFRGGDGTPFVTALTQRGAAAEVGFGGHCAKKLLEITTSPSNVPARESRRCTEKRRDAFDQ